MKKLFRFIASGTLLVLSSLIGSALAGPLPDSMLVVPVMSQNMAGTDPVLRFSFQGSGPTAPLSTIGPPAVVNPQYVAFSAQGELFVANRHDNFTRGSIARFTITDDGGFSANGVITGNGLIGVHGIAFSPAGELFAASHVPGTVSRFLFDSDGKALPHGQFTVGVGLQGLAFNPDGELFVARTSGDVAIYRYRFDAAGNPVPSGKIPFLDGGAPYGLAFSPAGELFAADASGHLRRFLFNAEGEAVSNGSVSVPIATVLGVAFSNTGEMFVSGLWSNRIYRYLFDEAGKALPHGEVVTGEVGFGMPALFPTSLSSAPFAAFTPRAELTLGPKANDDGYWVRGSFRLADASDGISPLTEPVHIRIGTFSHTVPAGSFTQDGAAYVFKGRVGASTLDVRISPLASPGAYWFKSCLKNGDLTGTTLPPDAKLVIGDDQGQAILGVGYGRFGRGQSARTWVLPATQGAD